MHGRCPCGTRVSFGWDSFKGKIIQALLPRDKEFDSASQMQPLGYMNQIK